MSQFPEAKFIKSANSCADFPPDDGVEVVFAGRSNSGKSSAINVIVNRKQFARTSKIPGRTQLINFFKLRNNQRLVDLPGYGYAKVGHNVKRHWGKLIDDYFFSRKSLTGLILLIDIRRGLTNFDLEMLTYAEASELNAHILLTKSDKLNRSKSFAVLSDVRKKIKKSITVQIFSSLTRVGVEDARKALEFTLDEKIR